MTRTMIALLTSAAMVIGSAVTLTAQGKKGSTPKPTHVTSAKTTVVKVSSPKTTSTSKVKTSGPKKTTVSPAPKGPQTTTVKATKPAKTTPSTKSAKANTKATTKPAKTDTKAAKVDAKKTAKAETKRAKADRKTTTTETTEKKTTKTTTTTTSGDGDTPVTLTKVQEKLQKNTKLTEKLEGRLPKGTDLMEAAEGFRNLGQFVAAVNVSNNLGLDFEQLKTAMVDDGKSLGQAIQYVKQDVESPTTVARTAETDAQKLIQESERQTTTTTTVRTTTTKTKSKDKPKRTLRTQSGS